jgi:hypothetical protein
MRYVSHTVYPPHFDPAPGRGKRPVMVGMTIKPTPNLTLEELSELIEELHSIKDEMLSA